jgi:hypothetical protein
MYDEYVYLLDLCIFSYHLHAQTLIWPIDPYYEQWKESKGIDADDKNRRRQVFMKTFGKQLAQGHDWRGPGACSGKTNNDILEPVITDYKRIRPWRASFTRPDTTADGWIVYNTPRVITDRIRTVNIVYDGPPPVQDLQLHPPPPGPMPVPSDLLYCFEGATGGIGMQGDPNPTAGNQAPVWSIMGFVLARTITDVDINLTTANRAHPVEVGYDIYIVFRGSRSGELRLIEAKFKKAGHPDWVTDLEVFNRIPDADINPHGDCARGFRTSLKHALPNVMRCLERIQTLKNRPPRSIFVTGHSLGGALATHFASAVLLGTKYGPNGLGPDMRDEIKIWPWRATRLVTFGTPPVGDERFQRACDATIDGTRVWLNRDIITVQIVGGRVVGESYHLIPQVLDKGVNPKNAHEPRFIRRYLIKNLLSRGFVLTDTPANSGNEELGEPWKVFTSCKEALGHIALCHQGQAPFRPIALSPQPAFAFADVLPNFDLEHQRYIRVVQDTLWDMHDPKLTEKSRALQDLGDHIGRADPNVAPSAASRILDAWAVWDRVGAADILPDWMGSAKAGRDSSFYHFVGLLLFISALARDSNLLQRVAVMGGPEAKAFNALLESTF